MSFKVGDQHRHNELSFIEGGYTVTVTHESGKSIAYDKVHYPVKYAETIKGRTNKDRVVQIKIADEIYWKL
jgi:hypothetical protein